MHGIDAPDVPRRVEHKLGARWCAKLCRMTRSIVIHYPIENRLEASPILAHHHLGSFRSTVMRRFSIVMQPLAVTSLNSRDTISAEGANHVGELLVAELLLHHAHIAVAPGQRHQDGHRRS